MPISFNKRTKNQQQTTDSIAPRTYKNPINLDPQSKSGYFIANQLDKRIKKGKLSNNIDDGRVLEVLGNGEKLKYKILTQTPDINIKEEKDGYMEDFLIKVRTRNDIGTKIDPEQILINELTNTMNDIEKERVKRKYLSAVADHDTFAPKWPTSFFGQAPKQGDIVKIYYNNCFLDSGEEIKGFYEVVNNNHDYFIKGDKTFAEIFKNLRAKYEEIFETIVPRSSDSKSPEVQTSSEGQSTVVPESVRVGDIDILPPPSVTDLTDVRSPPFSVRAPLPGDTSYRSPELYLKVIKQFQVHKNPRYDVHTTYNKQGKLLDEQATFCSLYVADVTMAMGTPIPWSPKRGSRIQQNPEMQIPKEREPYKGDGWKWADTPPCLYEDQTFADHWGAELMVAWCASPAGKKYGWVKVSDQEAQEHADRGFLTICGGPGMGHIAIVRPSLVNAKGEKEPFKSSRGPAIAEAGGYMSYNNDEGAYAFRGFGSLPKRGLKNLHYFTNKSDKMQVQLTDEQKKNLEQAKIEIQGQTGSSVVAQGEPAVEDPGMSLVEQPS